MPARDPDDLTYHFDAIMRDYGPALARLAWGYCDNPADRDDLFQDIALGIWRALPRFRGECSLRTFVYRIGHNRGIAHRLARRRTHHTLDSALEVEDPCADPATRAAATDAADRLLRAVRSLPEPLRHVVMLTLEGLSNHEVADIVGTTDNNVAVRLTRARRLLRERLGDSR